MTCEQPSAFGLLTKSRLNKVFFIVVFGGSTVRTPPVQDREGSSAGGGFTNTGGMLIAEDIN